MVILTYSPQTVEKVDFIIGFGCGNPAIIHPIEISTYKLTVFKSVTRSPC